MELVLRSMIYWEVRKQTKIKVLKFALQIWDFRSHLIVQIYYNLSSYRHEAFTGKYSTRKIQSGSRVAQASVRKSDAHMHPQLHDIKVARSDFWVTIPFNFERVELHHYQSNRKSNISGVLEKDESFKWSTFHQDLSYHSNEMTPCPILHKTE